MDLLHEKTNVIEIFKIHVAIEITLETVSPLGFTLLSKIFLIKDLLT
jgi:hypothetical protein